MMTKYILFRVGREVFGIQIAQVVEILNASKASPIPEAPEHIAGVITLRGNVIPLIDMRKRFGLESMPQKERIVVIKSGGEKIGLIVDEVFEIKGFTDTDVTQAPSIFKGVRTEYLKGLAKMAGGVAILLEIGRILSSEERILLLEGKDAQ